MTKSLKDKIISGSLWNLVGASGYQVIGLVIFIILSRLLTPGDFGTVALAIAFIELLNIVVQFGMIDVIIRSDLLKNSAKNTIFWLCALLGGMSSLALYFSAPFLERVFDIKGLREVVELLCIVPFLHSLTTVPEALLKRDFEFKPLAYRILLTSTIAGAVAIAMASNGLGMYSLVFQRVSSVLLVVIMLWLSVSWRPRFTLSFEEIKNQVRMGSEIMLTSSLTLSTLRVVEIIVGFFLGPAAVGFLKIAGKLHDFIFQLCIKPIVDVSLSAFSPLKSDDNKRNRAYLNFIQICSIFSLPAFLGFAVIAPEIINSVFGEEWNDSGMVMQIICISCISSTLNYFFTPLVVSMGRTDLALKIKMAEFILVSAVVSFTSQLSLMAVAFGSVLVTSVTTLQMLWVLKKFAGITLSSVFYRILPSLTSAVVMGCVIYFSKELVFDFISMASGLVLLIILGCFVYASFYYTAFRKTVNEVLTLGMEFIKKK